MGITPGWHVYEFLGAAVTDDRKLGVGLKRTEIDSLTVLEAEF